MQDQRRPGTSRPTPSRSEGVDARVEANERLTSLAGLVLLALLVIEIVTVALQPRQVLTLHVVVGLTLIPIVGLKLTSTITRIIAYYRGAPDYRRKGPPTPLLRFLSPILGALTVAFLVSGLVLIVGPRWAYGTALFVHKKILYLWLLALLVHLVAHARSAFLSVLRDIGRRRHAVTNGAGARFALLGGVTLLGVALAFVLSGNAASYLHAHVLR
jgi:hypothetical protein